MTPEDRKFMDKFMLILGILLAITFTVYILAQIIVSDESEASASDAKAVAALVERIRPVAVVAIAGQEDPGAGETPAGQVVEVEPVAAALSGPQVYNAACVACHGAGVAGAPKLGEADAWADRIAQGRDTLVQHALQGYQGDAGYMPPKGGRTDLSDAEIMAAVDYMTDESQ